MLNAICPLWSLDQRSWPDFLGSSTLMHFGDFYFLVSCAHVADNAQGREVFFIADDKLVKVIGKGRITNPPPGLPRSKDRVDCFFIHLAEETAEAMRDFYHFVGPEEIAVGQDTTSSTNYTFVGYPEKWGRSRGCVLRPEERSLTAAAMTISDYASLGLSSFTHIGIRLGGGAVTDFANRPMTVPTLNGISGGPVLMHFYEATHDPRILPRVVGLCMEQPPELPSVLLGVRLTAILESIRDRHPEISSVIPRDPDLDVRCGT